MARLVAAIVRQVLEAQVAEHPQAQVAEHPRDQTSERTEERRGYRNGDKPRAVTTRVDALELRVPQPRAGLLHYI